MSGHIVQMLLSWLTGTHMLSLDPVFLAHRCMSVCVLCVCCVCVAGVLLPSWLSDSDWRKRHAALICLAQIAEGCARVMSEQVEGLVTMCLQGLRDPHAKVRLGAGMLTGGWGGGLSAILEVGAVEAARGGGGDGDGGLSTESSSWCVGRGGGARCHGAAAQNLHGGVCENMQSTVRLIRCQLWTACETATFIGQLTSTHRAVVLDLQHCC
jgi:hypothetical protein